MAFSRARPQWLDFPNTTTLVRASDYEKWDQAVYDLKTVTLTVTDNEYGAKGDWNGTTGTDDTTAFRNAIADAKSAGRARIVVPPRRYLINSRSANSLLWLNGSNIDIEGYGAELVTTRSDNGGAFITLGENLSNLVDYRSQTVYPLSGTYVAGDQSLTLATAADAAHFSAGDYIFVRTGQTLNGSILNPDSETNRVVSSNSGTGVVTLRWPLVKPYRQEYFVSGTTGLTTSAVTSNVASFGISNVNAITYENVSVRGLRFTVSGTGSFYAFDGQQIVGLTVEDCIYDGTLGVPFMSGPSLSRFKHIRHNRAYSAGSGGLAVYHYNTDVGNSDVWIEDNVGTVQDGISQVHIHEGSANIRVRGNELKSAPSIAGDRNVISVRARAYNIDIVGNQLENGSATDSIYVDENCVGSGLIDGNTFSGKHNNSITILAPNWKLGSTNRTVGSGGAGAGQVQIYDQSYGATETLSNRVTPSLTTSFLGVLPAFCYVTKVEYWVEEAFNSSGTDTISVGYTAGTTNVASAADVSSGGIVSPTRQIGLNRTDRTLNAYYVAGGTTPTTGKAVVVVEFCRTRDAYA